MLIWMTVHHMYTLALNWYLVAIWSNFPYVCTGVLEEITGVAYHINSSDNLNASKYI